MAAPLKSTPRRATDGGDKAVQDTNLDAQISKLSAATLGYLHDDYVRHFVKRPQRRPPLINRGYYARDFTINSLLRKFMHHDVKQPKQILSLGAGFDTRFFQLKASNAFPCPVRYFEVDFKTVTSAKIATMQSTESLRALVPDLTADGQQEELVTPDFCIVSGDLRDFDAVVHSLLAAGFDLNVPTFVLSECVLIYLKKEQADKIVAWAGEQLMHSMFVCYEQIHPRDAFGEVMLRNLEQRGIVLHGIFAYPDLEAQRQRYAAHGFKQVLSKNMLDMYNYHIPQGERQRIGRLEFFDEVEEWNLIMQHYCLTCAVKHLPLPELEDHGCLSSSSSED